MKSLVKRHAKTGLWMEDQPKPTCGPNDVLIKIHKTAICGTDISIFKWDAWSAKTVPVPMIIGHEFVGVIEEVGEGVTGFSVGERVSGEGHLVCGTCRNCRSGRAHICANTVGLGYHCQGAFAEYLAFPAVNTIKVPDEISDDMAAIFDPLGNAVQTALAFDLVGETVLITGAGPQGMMASAIAKMIGAYKVVITDVNDERLQRAKEMGADIAINVARTSIKEGMAEHGIAPDFTVGLEMSGKPSGFNALIDHMTHGANVAILGLVPEGTGIDWPTMIFKGLTLKGIYGREMYETWFKMLRLLQTGLDVNKVITHQFKVDDFEKAFEVACAGQAGKVILNWQ